MDKIETQNSLTVLADQWQQIGLEFSEENVKSFVEIMEKRNFKTTDDLEKVYPDLKEKIEKILDDYDYSTKFKFYDKILYGNYFIIKSSRNKYSYWDNTRKKQTVYITFEFHRNNKRNKIRTIILDFTDETSGGKYAIEEIKMRRLEEGNSIVVFDKSVF